MYTTVPTKLHQRKTKDLNFITISLAPEIFTLIRFMVKPSLSNVSVVVYKLFLIFYNLIGAMLVLHNNENKDKIFSLNTF